MQAHDAVAITLKSSEVVTLAWLAFYSLYTLVAFLFADSDKNKQLVEDVGAYIFTMVAVASYVGGMATQYLCYALDIPWFSKSFINGFGIVVSICLTWAIAFRGWLWIGGLTIVVGLVGLILMLF